MFPSANDFFFFNIKTFIRDVHSDLSLFSLRYRLKRKYRVRQNDCKFNKNKPEYWAKNDFIYELYCSEQNKI